MSVRLMPACWLSAPVKRVASRVMTSGSIVQMQDFDELWEALISEASERALQQFSVLVDGLLRRHSGYR